MRVLETLKGTLVLGLATAAALALSGGPATASVMKYLSVEDLARESSEVLRVRISGQSVHWTADRDGIYTLIEAVVLGPIRGTAAPGRHLTIVQAGGVIDGVSLDWTGRPTFRAGEDLVVFLQPHDASDPSDGRMIVVGGKQGRMSVVPDPRGSGALMVERDLVGVLDAPFVEGGEPSPKAPRRDLMSIEQLRATVHAAKGGAR